MVVDAHAHVWKADPTYPNPSATIMSPTSDVPVDILRHYMDEHGVGRAVLVQPMYPGEDNSLVADAARAEPERFAAVAVVDPRKPDLLEYCVRERGCRGLRGARGWIGGGQWKLPGMSADCTSRTAPVRLAVVALDAKRGVWS